MTVICYRDGVMTSDSRCAAGNTYGGTMQKVMKAPNGWLIGGAGSAAEVNELLVWAEAGMDLEEVPAGCENLAALLVDPKGKVYCMDETYKPFPLKAKFHAEGSGANIARGAMAMGASAEEAVKIAIEFDSSCSGKIQKVRL